jgi:hypothetical protein
LKDKRKALSATALLLVLSWFGPGQTWFEVSMSPNDESVLLKSFDGYTAFAFISPLLLVSSAGFGMAMLSKKRSRTIALFIASVAQLSLAILALVKFASQDLSGVAKQIESATGIAANHGLDGVATNAQAAGFFAVAFLFLGGLALLANAISSRDWADTPKKTDQRLKGSKPKDSISLWDQQR